ncbi:MAG: enoyl-ACP reductase FabI [Pseudomonadota bacterium]
MEKLEDKSNIAINRPVHDLLKGKKALIIGVANEHSIAYGCAKAFSDLGAELAITYQTERTRDFVAPLLENLVAPIFMPCDVTQEGSLEAVYAEIEKKWGKLDIIVHAIAFAPKDDLQGRVVDCSLDGFLTAMNISCHSFIRMAKLAEPLMQDGGTLFTMTYYGSERVLGHYNMMGPVKAALESAVRYLAAELGPKSIRVHAISPGPLKTRAASGLKSFETLLTQAAEKAPTHQLTSIEDVGYTTAFLASDMAKNVTGNVVFIDGGYNIMG